MARAWQHVVLALLHCASCARHDFAPLDHYLAQFRLDSLRPLHVQYANGSSPVTLHGALTELYVEDLLLRRQPAVSWESDWQYSIEAGWQYSVFFIDFGRDMGGAQTQTSFFPYVHSLWTSCNRTLADCAMTVKPYNRPGNQAVIPNRYTYLLARHRGLLMLHGGPASRFRDRKLSKELQVTAST